jgi:DNA mismatch repair ATPase MutL
MNGRGFVHKTKCKHALGHVLISQITRAHVRDRVFCTYIETLMTTQKLRNDFKQIAKRCVLIINYSKIYLHLCCCFFPSSHAHTRSHSDQFFFVNRRLIALRALFFLQSAIEQGGRDSSRSKKYKKFLKCDQF